MSALLNKLLPELTKHRDPAAESSRPRMRLTVFHDPDGRNEQHVTGPTLILETIYPLKSLRIGRRAFNGS